MDPVASFTASDQDDDMLKWGVEGADGADFDITGGVLSFKKSPNYEMPTDRARENDPDTPEVDEMVVGGNNGYLVTVTATEIVPEGEERAPLKTTLAVVVNVTNEKEAGTAVIGLRQPEVGTALTASATDLDNINTNETVSYEWSIPKVSRPVLAEDNHWQAGTGTDGNTNSYTPGDDDEGKYLRVKVSYTDGKGTDSAVVLSEFTVREDVEAGDNSAPAFPSDDPITRDIPENSDEGRAVGDPVTASDPDDRDSGRLTYSIPTTGDATSFSIDKATGQLRVAGMLDKENGSTDGDGVYDVTVTVMDSSGETGREQRHH